MVEKQNYDAMDKKSPWRNPMTVLFGLIIVVALVFIAYGPDILKLGSQFPGGKIYEQGSGVAGYLRGIEPSYIMIYGDLFGSDISAEISFAGKYGITNSMFLSSATGSETNSIYVLDVSQKISLPNNAKLWIGSTDKALVFVDESKATLTVIGGSKAAADYAIEFLKNNQLCDKLSDVAVIILNNAQCADVYSPRAKISISSVPIGADIILGEDGNLALPMRGKTPFSESLKSGKYTLNVNATGYNQIIDSINVSLADQLNEQQISKSYNLVASTGIIAVETNMQGVSVEVNSVVKIVDAMGKASFDLAPGNYTVKAILKNYADQSKIALVEAGKTISVSFPFDDSGLNCKPTWSTGEWGVCTNKVQTRTVTKTNDCPLNTDKPTESQACCANSWTCTEWIPATCPTDVLGAKQTRTCTIVTGCEQSADPSPQITKDCPAPTQGTLKVFSDPINASVYADGILKGTTKTDGLSVVLDGGSHNVLVNFSGYEYASEPFEIVAGQTLSKTYKLNPFAVTLINKVKTEKNLDGFVTVIGERAALSDNIGGTDIAGYVTVSYAKTDAQVTSADKVSKHFILVGGPCVNSMVADLANAGKFPYTCANWSGSDFVIVKTIQDAFATGNKVIIVAGTTAEDTRRGARVVARISEFSSKLSKAEARFCGTKGNINSIFDCVTKICDEGAKQCSGSNLQQCVSNAWTTLETCANGCDSSTLSCKSGTSDIPPPPPPPPPLEI